MPQVDTCFAICEDTGTLLSWATCCQRAQQRRDLRGPRISSWRGTLPPAPPECLLGVRPATRLYSSAGWWWTAVLLCRDASRWLTLPGRIRIALNRSFSLLPGGLASKTHTGVLWHRRLRNSTSQGKFCGRFRHSPPSSRICIDANTSSYNNNHYNNQGDGLSAVWKHKKMSLFGRMSWPEVVIVSLSQQWSNELFFCKLLYWFVLFSQVKSNLVVNLALNFQREQALFCIMCISCFFGYMDISACIHSLRLHCWRQK